MTFGTFIRAARKRLQEEAAFYSPEECAALAKRMVLGVCRKSLEKVPKDDIQLVLAENEKIPSPVEEECEKALDRLCKGEPLEYVLGHAEFCGYEFRVNASTLIPRPETEELVSIVGEYLRTVSREALSGQCGINEGAGPVVLDLCTGSGCIAWSLFLDYVNGLNGAANPEQVRFYGCDISEEALAVAASQFHERPEEREMSPEFFKCDVLAPDAAEVIRHRIGDIKNVPLIIVCNPPYVCEKERAQMRSNVLDWEPSSALFVPDANPLVFYEAVADVALKLAQSSGRTKPALFFEINENLGPQTVEMLKSKNFTNARCLKDLFGKDRFIEA